jgi:hypothetical protein
MPSKMSDNERDDFMKQPHLGYLGIGRVDEGPLLAPIWYSYEPTTGSTHQHRCHVRQGQEVARGRTGQHARRRGRPRHVPLRTGGGTGHHALPGRRDGGGDAGHVVPVPW